MKDSGRREAFDAAVFETALQSVLQTGKRDYPSYIGGLKVASGKDRPLLSPVDSSIRFGTVQEPEEGTADLAAQAAHEAFRTWSAKAPSERAEAVRGIHGMLEAQRYKMAATVAVSAGMIGSEALAEADALLDIVAEALDEHDGVSGKPIGPWAVITSHSSPLASPMGYALTAILAGNTAVVMPSKHCPVPAYMVFDICVRSGLPDGVLNVLVDQRDETQTDLANNELFSGVVVSGTGRSFEEMMFLMVDDELRFYNELKGMNPIIVHRPSDMKKAAKDVLDSAFRYAGQGLYSSSKVIVTADDRNRLLDAILEQVKGLCITDPLEADAFSGPLISADAGAEFGELVKRVSGGTVYGGQPVVSEFTGNGVYVTPLIVTGLDEEAEESYMDFGLPMLYIKAVADTDEALEELVYTECGLSVGVYSRDRELIDRVKAEADAPLMFVNESSRGLAPGIHARIGNFLR